MGNKITDELFHIVKAVVGSADYTDMDIIRAIHMSNNDPTAAINIILDTPNFATARNSSQDAALPRCRPLANKRSNSAPHVAAADSTPSVSGNHLDDELDETKWWLVGQTEVSGLSTCRGRKLKSGEKLILKFPSANSQHSKSPSGKLIGRGRQQMAACSEIIRFSTQQSGEVILTCNLPFLFVTLH